MADDIPDDRSVEVDHVFVSCSIGAPEGDRLIELGLVEGSPNRHPGQGTANRRFFFANAMLELIWVHDPAEAQSDAQPARRLHLWERWVGRSGSATARVGKLLGLLALVLAGTGAIALAVYAMLSYQGRR